MPDKAVRFSFFRLTILIGLAALGLVTCSILSPESATFTPDAPTVYSAWRTQNIHALTNTKTEIPTFTPTLFPTLTYTPTNTWTPFPKDEWIGLGPEGGDVGDILFDPINPAVLYATTEKAGIFRSLNGGKVWENINTGQISIRQLFIDPLSPSTLYIFSVFGGIYRSMNGGDAWQIIYPDSPHQTTKPSIVLLAMDPSKPSTFYAKNNRQQILRSSDGGFNWVVAGDVKSLLGDYQVAYDTFLTVVPKTPATLFLGTVEGLYRSVDAGANWGKTSLSEQMDFLAANPASPEKLYAGKTYGALYSSTDGGEKWRKLQGADFSVSDLVVDPYVPSTLYAAAGEPGFPSQPGPDMAIQVSSDEGRHWEVIYQPGGIAINGVTVDPLRKGSLYAATSVGVFHSTDGGVNWDGQNTGLAAVDIVSMVVDPIDTCRIYIVANTALSTSEDCGAHWAAIDMNFPERLHPLASLIMDRAHSSTLYILSWLKLFKSLDGGMNWRRVEIEGAEYVLSVEMDPRDSAVLYAVTESGGTLHPTALYKSADGGDNWEPIASPAMNVQSLTLAPTTPTGIYALTLTGIYKSRDTGYTWQAVDAGIPVEDVEALLIDPVTPENLFVISKKNRIYVSRDGGESWRGMNSNLPQIDYPIFAIDPANPSTMYAYSFLDGIFRSRDAGRNWAPFTAGLHTNRINTMAFDPKDPFVLYAGTGGGFYAMQLSG